MRTLKTIHTLSCHAEGEVGDVIIDGVEPPPGRTVAELSLIHISEPTRR